MDTNHDITATLDAQSRLVISNVYNSQDRLTAQYTQGDTNKAWRLFWSGWATVEYDPATGVSKRWHSNGRLKFETHLINEIFNGRVRLWSESGELKQETFQIANRRVSKEEYEKACASNPALPKYTD